MTLIPPHKQGKWRQRWWWKEKLPGIISLLVVAVLAVAVGWVTVIFTGDDENSPAGQLPEQTAEPSRAAPSATSNRPREKPPERPDAMSQDSAAGIEATARYEFDAINHGQRTGDLDPLKRVYDLERCELCARLTSEFEDLTANGRYLEGASYTVVSVANASVLPRADGGARGLVEIGYRRDAGRQVEPDGSPIQEIDASPLHVSVVSLSFDNGAWRITSSAPKERK